MFNDRTGAVISDCQKFRYRLWRRWNFQLPRLMFIMLNPSTADATLDDATIRKCIGFATRLGYGGIEVCNLYAFRATDPRDLKAAGYPIGDKNDGVITGVSETVSGDWGHVVAAWGANAQDKRADEVRWLCLMNGVPLYHLGLTKDGQPRHPLMLPYSAELTEWVY